MTVSQCVFLSVSRLVCLFLCPSICQSACWSVSQSVFLSVSRLVCLFLCPSVCQSACWSVGHLSVFLSDCLLLPYLNYHDMLASCATCPVKVKPENWCKEKCHLLFVSYNNPRPHRQAKDQIKHVVFINI